MRMSCWTPDVVRLMDDADRLSPYFAELAAIAAHECPQGGRVLDAGCGMGQLSLALAGHAGHIDAVDRNKEAIDHLKDTLASRRIANVRPICADMFAWGAHAAGAAAPGGQAPSAHRVGAWPHQQGRANTRHGRSCTYDLAVFCLSASFEDAYAAACRMGARRVLVINKIHAHNPYEPRPVVDDFERAVERAQGIDPRARGMRTRLDYGQPLRSLEDAVVYFSLFRTRSYPHGVTCAQVEKLLERRADPEFPYYLPVWRELAIFACETSHRALPEGLGCNGAWDATNATAAASRAGALR